MDAPDMRISVIILSMLGASACTHLELVRLLDAYEITLADASQTDTTKTQVESKVGADGKPAKIISVFFGLDDALPKISNKAICPGAGGKDGMPIVFSHELDVRTMQAGDFRVTTASGKTGHIHCVTLAPADDAGELRTALLAGHYGSQSDQPAKLEVVGNLLSMDGSVNFKGLSAGVIRLEEGPTMVLAEVVPESRLGLGKSPTQLPFGGGTGCPVGTRQVVNVTWAGGVTKPGGAEAGEEARLAYTVTIRRADDTEVEVTPFALADLVDGDNNHRLCLDVEGTPVSVSLPAGYLTDPANDPNPATTIRIE